MKLLIYLFIAFNITSCQQDDKTRLTKDDFTIVYPSNLQIDESGQGGTSFVLMTQKEDENDVFVENINLVIKNTDNEDLEEFSRLTEKEINEVANIIDSKRLQINGKSCFRLVIEATQNNTNFTFIQHYYLENKKIYLLTFSSETKAYNDYYDEMNEVLMSFKIK